MNNTKKVSFSFSFFLIGLIVMIAFGAFFTYSIWQDNPYDEFVNPATDQLHYDSVAAMLFGPALVWTLACLVIFGAAKLIELLLKSKVK
jgi:hypothetical protein